MNWFDDHPWMTLVVALVVLQLVGVWINHRTSLARMKRDVESSKDFWDRQK